MTDRHVRAAIADSEFAAVAKPRGPALYVAATLAAGWRSMRPSSIFATVRKPR